jgi:ubiquinone/menaquinone biosynthesis C-methylase UbiE
MHSSPPSDVWASGTAYEHYVGRWSRLVAREFLGWLALPADSTWLDIGCGTGALSRTILQIAAPRDVTGIDRSADYIAHLRSEIDDQRARFEVGDAQALPVKT